MRRSGPPGSHESVSLDFYVVGDTLRVLGGEVSGGRQGRCVFFFFFFPLLFCRAHLGQFGERVVKACAGAAGKPRSRQKLGGRA